MGVSLVQRSELLKHFTAMLGGEPHLAMAAVHGQEAPEFVDWFARLINPEVNVRLVGIPGEWPDARDEHGSRLLSTRVVSRCRQRSHEALCERLPGRAVERVEHPSDGIFKRGRIHLGRHEVFGVVT